MEKRPLVYALIPARGGSKRVPGKNIKLLCGKPLLAWSVDEAKKSRFISKIIVSTDDSEIADVAKHSGAEVPFLRPKEIAGDMTPDLPVFEHVLKWCRDSGQPMPDILVHLRATGPLRTVADIDKGIELLIQHPEYDSVRAVIPTPLHPLKTYRLEGDTLQSYIPDTVSGMKEPYNQPVQALPKAYAAVGYFSAIWSKTILQKQSMTGERMLGYVVSADNATDIDTPLDFLVAEERMKARLAQSK